GKERETKNRANLEEFTQECAHVIDSVQKAVRETEQDLQQHITADPLGVQQFRQTYLPAYQQRLAPVISGCNQVTGAWRERLQQLQASEQYVTNARTALELGKSWLQSIDKYRSDMEQQQQQQR